MLVAHAHKELFRRPRTAQMGSMCAGTASTVSTAAPTDAALTAGPCPLAIDTVRLRHLTAAGDLEGVQALLVQRDGPLDSSEIMFAFELACRFGQLRIAQWALDRDRACMNKFLGALRVACLCGHLAVIEWLLSLAEELFWRLNVDVLFAELCGAGLGCLDTLQCLVARVPHLDIHANQEDAFTRACEHGHVHVAQWLLAQGGVDIHAARDRAFVLACMNRRLRMAKWLWSLGGVNVHSLDDWVARSCSLWRHFEFNGKTDPLYMALKVCQWVFRLDPREAAWPKDMVDFVKRWSPDRDAWMRSVCARPA